LAITLGVGVALGSAPAVASAEPTSSSSSAGDSSAGTSSSSATSTSGGTDSDGGAQDGETSESSDADADEDADADDAADTDDDEQDAEDDAGDEDAEPVARRHRDSSPEPASTTSAVAVAVAVVADDADDAEALTADVGQSTESGDSAPDVVAGATATAAEVPVTPAISPAPAAPEPTEVTVVSAEFVSTGLQPLAQPGPEVPPVQTPVMLAALGAVRDELERNTLRRKATASTQQAVTLLADPSPNVLLIGVDGANLSRVLVDPANANFFELIQNGTTAAASIAGHTTISNPSWSSILTGAWGERTGVINNVFTPWTFDRWPTVFNQLEAYNSAIQTTAIANWDVIAAIADAGSMPADDVRFVSQIEGDTDWLLTDDAVGDHTEAVIAAADPDVPNFVFSYFVGVDENGHLYGGASPQYADALLNFDRNLGEILDAVNAWETATGEQWTIIMVTDHGHQPQQGLGHGFQSPDETSTFVIVENPDIFAEGAINLQYQIVDVTPTVMTLFGGPPPADADGVSVTELDAGNEFPGDDEALRDDLLDAIAANGYPDIGTQLALGVRTIATSVPYFVFGFTNQFTSALRAIADQDILLISLLAKVAILPVQLVGDIAYVATNVVAQIVARLTGVTGARIFPLWPPAPPSFPSTPEEATTVDAAAACGDSRGSAAAWWCGEPAIAV